MPQTQTLLALSVLFMALSKDEYLHGSEQKQTTNLKFPSHRHLQLQYVADRKAENDDVSDYIHNAVFMNESAHMHEERLDFVTNSRQDGKRWCGIEAPPVLPRPHSRQRDTLKSGDEDDSHVVHYHNRCDNPGDTHKSFGRKEAVVEQENGGLRNSDTHCIRDLHSDKRLRRESVIRSIIQL